MDRNEAGSTRWLAACCSAYEIQLPGIGWGRRSSTWETGRHSIAHGTALPRSPRLRSISSPLSVGRACSPTRRRASRLLPTPVSQSRDPVSLFFTFTIQQPRAKSTDGARPWSHPFLFCLVLCPPPNPRVPAPLVSPSCPVSRFSSVSSPSLWHLSASLLLREHGTGTDSHYLPKSILSGAATSTNALHPPPRNRRLPCRLDRSSLAWLFVFSSSHVGNVPPALASALCLRPCACPA